MTMCFIPISSPLIGRFAYFRLQIRKLRKTWSSSQLGMSYRGPLKEYITIFEFVQFLTYRFVIGFLSSRCTSSLKRDKLQSNNQTVKHVFQHGYQTHYINTTSLHLCSAIGDGTHGPSRVIELLFLWFNKLWSDLLFMVFVEPSSLNIKTLHE